MKLSSLKRRDPDVTELMDDPECDPVFLDNTYKRFHLLNVLVSGWGSLYRELIRPHLSAHKTTRVLDVGCGGGDISRNLARRASHDGFLIDVLGIDPNPRAYAFSQKQKSVPGAHFAQAHTSDLVREGQQFDFVVSNHVLHHLTDAELDGLFTDSDRLAKLTVIHADIARSRLAYCGFAGLALPFARHSFIRVDGLASIRRSFTVPELQNLVPPGWNVHHNGRFRLLVTREAQSVRSVVRKEPEAAGGAVGFATLDTERNASEE